MTDETPKTGFSAMFAQCMAAHAENCRRIADRRTVCKTALFDALAKAGITTITVDFDGSGDSGQIETIRAMTDLADVPLPEATIKFVQPGQDDDSPIDRYLEIRDAIEELL